MPWQIKQNVGGCKGFAVVKEGTTTVVGCHPSKSRAAAHMRALYANVKDVKKINNNWDGSLDPKNIGRKNGR